MRALLSKVMTGSMVAGAALLVTACGGNKDEAANNTAMTEMGANDMTMEMGNDVTAVDAGTNMAGNMSTDMTMNANTTSTTTNTTTTTTDADMTNGM